jgi:L-cysteine/cystine lyase
MKTSKREFLKLAAASVCFLNYGSLNSWGKTNHKRKLASTNEWDEIRNQFSLTKNRVYFNNGTIGPSPEPVLECVISSMKQVDFMSEHNENHGTILREKIAQFIHASAEEISLTHNTTEAINIIARGLKLEALDEIIITTHEHVGNALPWLNRARLDDVVLKSFEPKKTAEEVIAQVRSLITSKTKVIAVPYISCTTGQVFPIKQLAKLAHDKNIFIFVDGAHALGMLPLNMLDLGIDFFATCGHKWMCGPKGTGFLYIKKSLIDKVEANFVGAYSDTGWSLTPPKIEGFNPTAHRYDYGSQNTSLYAGFSAAIDFFNQIGMEKIKNYGFDLASTLQEELLKLSELVEVLTPTENQSRAMMISFRFKNKDYKQFANYAAKNGFRIRQVPEANLNAIRVSTHLYNSKEEVFNFVKVVERFSKEFLGEHLE